MKLATVAALPDIIGFFRSRGYAFVNLLGDTGVGYLILTANGVFTVSAPAGTARTWAGSGLAGPP